jgi:hypothetical protein
MVKVSRWIVEPVRLDNRLMVGPATESAGGWRTCDGVSK